MTRKGKDAPHKFIQTHVSVLNSVVPMAPLAVSWRPTGDLLATYWRPTGDLTGDPTGDPTGNLLAATGDLLATTGDRWLPGTMCAPWRPLATLATWRPGDLATWRPGDLATAVATALCC